MNKREKMYASIQEHGQNLLELFPNTAEQDPIKLCKKLRTLECQAEKHTTDLCNGLSEWQELAAEQALDVIELKVRRLLGLTSEDTFFFINRDPRGYALKIRESWRKKSGKKLYKDWGGHGILAPNFSEN